MGYKRVYLTTDGSGHNYIIPFELKDEFNKLSDLAENDQDFFEEFCIRFGEYELGGDYNLVELYIKN